MTLKVCLQYLTNVLKTAETAMLASPSPIPSIDFAPRSCSHQERLQMSGPGPLRVTISAGWSLFCQPPDNI